MSTKHLFENFQKVVLPAGGRSSVPGEGAWTTESQMEFSPNATATRHFHTGHHLSVLLGGPEWEPPGPLRLGIWDYFI